jgi:Fungal specific transcription factor domain
MTSNSSRQYEAFRESPLTTSPLWIALLFTILSITVSLRRFSNPTDLDASFPSPKTLQQRAVQCLLLGGYATANTHALEALFLHIQSCFLSHDFEPVDLWFEMGTIIRLAIRMAYHRDPSKLAGISPFDGEMRRRVWLNIVQVDALMSFQLGFPSMIPSESCDTQTPRNLEHSDLYVSMTRLPPSRPLSESTPVRYTIVKNSIMAIFKKIATHTQSLATPGYDKTIALDIEMKQAYINMPEALKRRDVNRSFMDPSALIWERCSIELLYLKGLIVLHRRYISYESQSPIFAASRRACVDAALDILARLVDIHKACEAGGRLFDDRWMFYSIPLHDFLLAAMVVCLDLSVRMRSDTTTPTGEQGPQELTAKEYQALQSSLHIWTNVGSIFPEAHTAALAIDLMIKKVTVAENEANLPAPDNASSADTTLAFDFDLPYATNLGHMIDGSESIDWVSYLRLVVQDSFLTIVQGLLDQYFQNLDSTETSRYN